jgi:hypothetical protein
MTSQVEFGVSQIEQLVSGKHKARARREAEAFESALLSQVATPSEQALARTAATMFLAVRLYHYRRLSRAKIRERETAELVSAGNTLERLLERLGLIGGAQTGQPGAEKVPTPQSSANVSRYQPVEGCTCKPGDSLLCVACQAHWARR